MTFPALVSSQSTQVLLPRLWAAVWWCISQDSTHAFIASCQLLLMLLLPPALLLLLILLLPLLLLLPGQLTVAVERFLVGTSA
jgi:hypothetical protein